MMVGGETAQQRRRSNATRETLRQKDPSRTVLWREPHFADTEGEASRQSLR